METSSAAAELLNLLEAELPGVVKDGALSPSDLLGALGLREEEEHRLYSFGWAGQRKAERLATEPTTATLAPAEDLSVDWGSTKNVLIEGDNLQALKVLHRGLHDQVRLIYLDPPYNVGKTFTYSDDFSVPEAQYLRDSGQVDASGNLLSSKVDTAGSKHAGWLTMMLPRLLMARSLLREDGLLFISIDDNEVHHLRLLLDGVFGPDNRLATLVWSKGHSQQQGIFKEYHEYVLVYAKEANGFQPFASSGEESEILAGAMKKVSRANPESDFTFPAGIRCDAADGTEFRGTWGDGEQVRLVSGRFRVKDGVTQDEMTLSAGWTQKDQMRRMYYGDGSPVMDTRGQEVLAFFFNSKGKIKISKRRRVFTPDTVLKYGTQSSATEELASLFGGTAVFDVPKPTSMLRDFVSWACPSDGDIAVDFFAGSGTLGQAVYEQNAADGVKRRFLLVQAQEDAKDVPESARTEFGIDRISDITRLRLVKAADRLRSTGAGDDLGFRLFRVTEGVLPGWSSPAGDAKGREYVEAAALFAEGWSAQAAEEPETALWEVILKATPCDPAAEVVPVDGVPHVKQVRQPDDDRLEGRLLVSVAPQLETADLDALLLTGQDTLVCFSGALSDSDAINAGLSARLLLIERVPGAVSV